MTQEKYEVVNEKRRMEHKVNNAREETITFLRGTLSTTNPEKKAMKMEGIASVNPIRPKLNASPVIL